MPLVLAVPFRFYQSQAGLVENATDYRWRSDVFDLAVPISG